LEARVLELNLRLEGFVRRVLRLAGERLESRKKRLRHPTARLVDLRLRLDEQAQRLEFAARQRVRSENQMFLRLQDNLLHLSPSRRLSEARGLLGQYWHRLELFVGQILQKKRQGLERSLTQLDGLSPLGILARGYSITCTWPKGEVVRSIRQVREADTVKVRLHEGSLRCNVVRVEE
jgi:exodeoxyribonuclease VII large subunit